MKIYKEVELELNPEEVREQFEQVGAQLAPEIDPVEAMDKLWLWLKKLANEVL